MTRTLISGLLAALVTVMVPVRSEASQIGILQQISPNPTTYTLGSTADFMPMELSGLGDVTGLLQAIDLLMPPAPVPTSTSGCEASDFAAFVIGSIALMQRGGCNFEVKTANAAAAGAIGALIFNEGQVGRTEAGSFTNGTLGAIPVATLSFALGEQLYSQLFNGRVTMRLQVTDNTRAEVVPEPGTFALVGLGIAVVVARRRRNVR